MSRISPRLRQRVEKRACGRCEYCQLPTEGQVAWFPIDHVIPLSQGGKTTFGNLALACPRCNGYKWAQTSAMDRQTGRTARLFNPRRQSWERHFQWTTLYTIEGRTATGRATVEALRMNASEIVAIRKLLSELGIPVASESDT